MSYGMGCPFENRYSGECRKPYGATCPEDDQEWDVYGEVDDDGHDSDQGFEPVGTF